MGSRQMPTTRDSNDKGGDNLPRRLSVRVRGSSSFFTFLGVFSLIGGLRLSRIGK